MFPQQVYACCKIKVYSYIQIWQSFFPHLENNEVSGIPVYSGEIQSKIIVEFRV